MLVRLALGLMWLTHFLPLRALDVLGGALGMGLYVLGRERRRVARTNLKLCFPALAPGKRERLVRRHFRAFGRSFIERGILWWSSPERIRRLVRIEGEQHWREAQDRPVILLAPHFVGLDMGWARLATEFRLVSVYSNQKDPHFNRVLLRGRLRFGKARLYSRQQGIRPVLQQMRAGMALYYLPDLDYGARNAIFVPFFGVSAATITGLSRIARMTGAVVLPCVTRQLRSGGYAVELYPAWRDFPGGSIEQDTRRMNEFIEARVREIREQYFWLHKRFKTRPPGEPSPYARIE